METALIKMKHGANPAPAATSSADLMARWQAGDQGAAEELFRRYAGRLQALVRSRLSARLARHVDPEDVVQSVYQSFFVGARDGRFVLSRGGDLWRLLVSITLNKLCRRAEQEAAPKRSAGLGRRRRGGLEGAPARDPTPAEAAGLADTLEQALRGLSPAQRRMVELRLQGYALEEIALDAHRSERTVRRLLDRVKDRLLEEARSSR